jgi:hypothetical protein
MLKLTITIIAAAFMCSYASAQDTTTNLFDLVDKESKLADSNAVDYTSATFKSNRLINGHTVETTPKGILDFKISHRFGAFSLGGYEAFGLDNATMRIGLDYGLTDRLMIGVGRSTFEKQYDGFFKYKLLRQSSGRRNMPVTVSIMSSVMLKTIRPADVDDVNKNYYSNKLYYATQLLIARKFNNNTSVQLMPTMLHFNRVPAGSSNDIFALGVGGRQKVSKRISINAEYYYVLPEYKLPGTHNSLAVGVDIETGGHVFQLHFTNSMGMTERTFIAETTDQWSDGDIHFGFNISRVFNIGKKKKAKQATLNQ